MIYWAIATSEKYPMNVYHEKIDADNDGEAWEKAEKWNDEHNGFRYTCVVGKDVPKPA